MVHKFTALSSLIIGTTIGAGMLSLPLLCQDFNGLTILFLFISSAFIMYKSASYLVEISSLYPEEANIISYLKNTQPQLIIPTKIIYILFLWALLSAYLTALSVASSFIFSNNQYGQTFYTVSIILFLICSPMTRSYLNKWLVIAMFVSLMSLGQFISISNIFSTNLMSFTSQSWSYGAYGIIMMSFGFHHIIPSLKQIEKDSTNLKNTIIMSICIIIGVYLLWVMMILAYSQSYNIRLNQPLDFLNATGASSTNIFNMTNAIGIFSYLASLTSSLGVSIGLMDFIRDLLANYNPQKPVSKTAAAVLTILPSLLINLIAQDSFILILSWASYLALYILILLPCWIHYKKFKKTSSLVTAFVAATLILFA